MSQHRVFAFEYPVLCGYQYRVFAFEYPVLCGYSSSSKYMRFPRQTYRFLTYFYVLGILFFSTRADVGGGVSPLWLQHFKNFLHIPAYAGLTYFLVISFGRIKWWTLVSAFCAAVFYGGANEIVQMSAPGRSCSWEDVGRNAFGAALVVVVLWIYDFRRRIEVRS